jgi:hypothetical protein
VILLMLAVVLLLLRLWNGQRIVRREREQMRRHVSGGARPWWGE